MAVLLGSTVNNHYEILQEIGEGGFAWVYKARDLELGRIVALKVMKTHGIPDEKDLARFQREAKFLAQLKHPNVVHVYSFELVNDSQPCIVMEFLEGQSLASYLRSNQKLAPAIINHVFLQICSGLSYAHKLGFVHRDLTPSNIFLIGEPQTCEVKIIDFGLSKLLAESPNKLTQTGLIIGTPAYMSPELIRSQAIDQRSDIYSLGCIMYEALSGKAPFTANSPIGLLHLQQHEYPSEPVFGLDKPEQNKLLSQIVLRCLQKDPDQRFQSCDEIASALISDDNKTWLNKSASQSVDIHPWSISRRHRQAIPRIAALAIIICLALACVVPLFPKHGSVKTPIKAKQADALIASSVSNKELELVHSLERAERLFGADNPGILIQLSELAEFYSKQRKEVKAEPLLKRELAIQEKNGGKNELIQSINVLAGCYAKQRKTSEAELLYKRALSMREKWNSPSFDMADQLEAVGYCLASQRKFSEAEPLLKRALSMRLKLFPFKSSRLERSFFRLGKMYCSQERFSDAEPLLTKSLSMYEAEFSLRKTLAEHSETFDCIRNLEIAGRDLYWSYLDLADCYLQEKQHLKKAESLLERAKTLTEMTFNLNDASRSCCLTKLSCCYRLQGRLKEAEELSNRAIEIINKTPTAEEYERCWSSYELAACYLSEGRLTEAEALYQRVLEKLENDESTYSPDYPEPATVRQELAKCYQLEGKNAEAARLLNRVQ